MPFPQRLMNDNEDIVLDLHPHWWFFGPSALGLSGSMILTLWVNSSLSGWLQTAATYLGLGIVVVCAAVLIVELVKWRTIYFVVTTDRVIYRQGVVARSGVEIPLERISNVNFKQSILERLLGVGDILVQSGGEDGEQTFGDISRPEEVQNIVNSCIQSRATRTFTGAPSLSGIAHELERLEALRDRGTLTDEEFEEQKRRLLG
jgi:uncharacterized membrane protein YdbT with pleckstrin-like domain